MTFGALILAAGAGTRWQGPTPKPLATYAGATFLDRATQAALGAGASPVIRVLGSRAQAILSASPSPPGTHTVVNPDWADGMGRSLAFGLEAALRLQPGLAAVCVLLADQPLVTADHLRVFLRAVHASGRSIGLCDYGDATRGPPAIFLRTHFPALLALTGDSGARHLARAHPESVLLHPLSQARHDIDTPEAYAALDYSNRRPPAP